MKLYIIFLFLFISVATALPVVSYGAVDGQVAAGLVSCSGPDCNFCTFMTMVDNVVDWLFSFLVLAAVALLVYAGFKLVVSAGNPSAMTDAKGMVTNVLVGFVIVLSAWLIVDTMMKALVKTDTGEYGTKGATFGMWNSLGNCGVTCQNPRTDSNGNTICTGGGF